ncbi:hypothetical protein [Desulfallas sp. Bu1-1]|uniref:hypothetical protein n=1 Tax=Desulfallas sp. Bu1-1 TaxID=2787620 RepID=UPI001FAE7104|nr:hypothetical protein [Desulfallas sp. Bu1-1]
MAAIEWALTGRNMWTDRAGRGAGDLVTRGEKYCQVGLEMAGFGGVVRATPSHTLTAGRYRSVQEGQAAIYHHLGTDESLLQLVLNAGAFTGMPPAEQKAFLFSLCGVSFTADEIASAVAEHVRRTGAAEELAREAARRSRSLMPKGINGDPGILEGKDVQDRIAGLEKALAGRDAARRDLRSLEAAIESRRKELETPGRRWPPGRRYCRKAARTRRRPTACRSA